MTETTPTIEVVELTEIVGEIETPCDFGSGGTSALGEHDDPARWVLIPVRCCAAARARLVCERCKEVRVTGNGGVVCGDCGHVSIPSRSAYSRIEAL